MFQMLGYILPLLLGPLAAAQRKSQGINRPLPEQATTISPQITQPQTLTRKRLANSGGRKSTLITGGLFGNPALLKQGLSAY